MDHQTQLPSPDAPSPGAGNPGPNTAPGSPRRLAANRANAAKSRGPITPEGKARSSRNAVRHGHLAETIVLEQEDAGAFASLAAELHAHLRPANPVAKLLVDDLAAAYWRRNRIRTIETETFNIAIEQQTPQAIDPTHAAALAFRDLCDNSVTLHLLNRYETRFDRQIVRTLRLYQQLNQPDNENFQTNPIPSPNTDPIVGRTPPSAEVPRSSPQPPAPDPQPLAPEIGTNVQSTPPMTARRLHSAPRNSALIGVKPRSAPSRCTIHRVRPSRFPVSPAGRPDHKLTRYPYFEKASNR